MRIQRLREQTVVALRPAHPLTGFSSGARHWSCDHFHQVEATRRRDRAEVLSQSLHPGSGGHKDIHHPVGVRLGEPMQRKVSACHSFRLSPLHVPVQVPCHGNGVCGRLACPTRLLQKSLDGRSSAFVLKAMGFHPRERKALRDLPLEFAALGAKRGPLGEAFANPHGGRFAFREQSLELFGIPVDRPIPFAQTPKIGRARPVAERPPRATRPAPRAGGFVSALFIRAKSPLRTKRCRVLGGIVAEVLPDPLCGKVDETQAMRLHPRLHEPTNLTMSNLTLHSIRRDHLHVQKEPGANIVGLDVSVTHKAKRP